jgi:hypothetical protein
MSYRIDIKDLVATQPTWTARVALEGILRSLTVVEGHPVRVEGDDIITDEPDAVVSLIDDLVNVAAVVNSIGTN